MALRSNRKILFVLIWLATILLTFLYASSKYNNVAFLPKDSKSHREIMRLPEYNNDNHNSEQKCHHDENMPIIFIGGMPRSGTTLMRTMLDAHPDIRCGQETRVIPRMLFMRNNWIRSPKERQRLTEAGILPKVLDKAMMQFILEIIVNHGAPAKFLCNKDPFTLKATVYLHELFPNAKFVLMLRDGRATAHSIITRKVTIAGFDIRSYRDVLTKWNAAMDVINNQCLQVGTQYCLPVHYEQLVLQPVAETKRIFNFLNIPWSDNVLHHENHMDDIQLSKLEKSTDQVVRPLYLEGLNSWVGHIPKDVENDLPIIAPMLAKLGYDPFDPSPKYGEPDEFIKALIAKNSNITGTS